MAKEILLLTEIPLPKTGSGLWNEKYTVKPPLISQLPSLPKSSTSGASLPLTLPSNSYKRREGIQHLKIFFTLKVLF